MLKVLQGGIRRSHKYGTAVSTLVAGMGVIPISGSVSLPTSTSGTVPLGLVFDSNAEAGGSNLSNTGGGGGSSTLMQSTGSTNNLVTVIAGNFIGATDQFSGITSADTGTRLTVNTSGQLVPATASGEYVVGTVLEYVSSTEIQFIWFSAGAQVK